MVLVCLHSTCGAFEQSTPGADSRARVALLSIGGEEGVGRHFDVLPCEHGHAGSSACLAPVTIEAIVGRSQRSSPLTGSRSDTQSRPHFRSSFSFRQVRSARYSSVMTAEILSETADGVNWLAGAPSRPAIARVWRHAECSCATEMRGL